MRKVVSLSVSTMSVLLASAAAAFAAPVSGTAYCNIGQTYVDNGVTLGNLAAAEASSSGQCAQFSSSAINYSSITSSTNNANLMTFLTSSPGNTTLTQAPPASQSALGTLLVLTGQSYLVNGTYYTLSHDDGVNLYISGNGLMNYLEVASGKATAAGEPPFRFDGTTGLYSFELLYTSNYVAPSQLMSNIAQTPEPSTLMLLGTGLAGVGGAMRRRMRRG